MTFNDDLFSQVHPSIFELIAQENMEDSLKPAMKYTTKVTIYNLHHTMYVANSFSSGNYWIVCI